MTDRGSKVLIPALLLVTVLGCGDDTGGSSPGGGGGAASSSTATSTSASTSSGGDGGGASTTVGSGGGGAAADGGGGSTSEGGGGAAAMPSLAECPDDTVEGANLAWRLGTDPVRCARIEGYFSAANGQEAISGQPTNLSQDKAGLNITGDPIEVGTETVGTRAENGTVTGSPMNIQFGGTYCDVAGTSTVEAFEYDGASGTVSGVVVGDVNPTCVTPPEPDTYTPVVARFVDIPVLPL